MKRKSLITLEDWKQSYSDGIDAGVRIWENLIPTMVGNWGEWIGFVVPDIVSIKSTIPEAVADPYTNYVNRGLPFAEMFRSKSKEYWGKIAEQLAKPIAISIRMR